MEARPNPGNFGAHLDRRQFLRTLSFTDTFAGFLVLTEIVQNPSRKGDPVIKRQLRLRGARRKIAPSWPRMCHCYG